MDLHKKKIVDTEQPLLNEARESFCNHYVRLDLEDKIVNKTARRVMAYRLSFPETIKDSDSIVNSRATSLLSKNDIIDRISFIYEQEGTSVEAKFAWTKNKSEEALMEIVFCEDTKDGDKIKAIQELNKMRGIEKPLELIEENNNDEVDSFFDKIKKLI